MSRTARAAFPAPVLIAETPALAALCERLAREPYVTIDTEFMRERTYYPELCVVQLAGSDDVASVRARSAVATSAWLSPVIMCVTDASRNIPAARRGSRERTRSASATSSS